jgi:hypothetical protein
VRLHGNQSEKSLAAPRRQNRDEIRVHLRQVTVEIPGVHAGAARGTRQPSLRVLGGERARDRDRVHAASDQ